MEPVSLKPDEIAEHARRNAECVELLARQMAQRDERSLLVVSLEPGLHRSRRTGLICNIRDLPGVELIADGSNLPPSIVEELLVLAHGRADT